MASDEKLTTEEIDVLGETCIAKLIERDGGWKVSIMEKTPHGTYSVYGIETDSSMRTAFEEALEKARRTVQKRMKREERQREAEEMFKQLTKEANEGEL